MRRRVLLTGLILAFSSSIQSQSIISKSERKADKYFLQQSYIDAAEIYRKIVDHDPGNKRATLKLARTYLISHQIKDAYRYYKLVIYHKYLVNSIDYLNYAGLLYSINKLDSAEWWAQQYLNIDPINERAQNLLFRLKYLTHPELNEIPNQGLAQVDAPVTGTLLSLISGGEAKSYVLTENKVIEVMRSSPFQQIEWLEGLLMDYNIIINDRVSIHPVLFHRGQSVIDEHHKSELRKLAEIMKKYELIEFEISGHSDTSGSETHNQRLSQLRASAARDYLSTMGIQTERLLAVGHGATNLICKDQPDSCGAHGHNRRLEFRLVYMNKERMISSF